jgi:hypothetical protein
MLAGHELGVNVKLGPGLSTKNALLYLMVVGIAINSAVARNRRIEILPVFATNALLVLYAIVTWIVIVAILDRPEYSPRATLISLKSTLVDYFLTLAVFFYGVLNRKDALWLLKAIVVLVLISNAVTLVDSFNIPDLGIIDSRLRDGRFVGFMGAANDYAMLLVFFLPISIALYQSSAGKARLLAGIGVALTCICLTLTASRGAYVGVLGGLIMSAIFLRRILSAAVIIRGAVITFAVLALLTPVVILLGYSELYLDRLGLFEGNAHIASSGRTTYWLRALGVMAESPLSFITGFGFEAYELSRKFSAAMHNHYLNKLFNLGLIGMGLFVAVFGCILAIFRASVPSARSDVRPYLIALTIGLICLLVTQFFGQYYRSAYLIWASLGVGLRLAVEVMRDSVQAAETEMNRQSRARP